MRPKPDWGRKGMQPKGELGPPPGPNGRIVATKPGTYRDPDALDERLLVRYEGKPPCARYVEVGVGPRRPWWSRLLRWVKG